MENNRLAFHHDGTFTGLISAAAAAFENRKPFGPVPLLLSERDKQLKEATPHQAELFDQTAGSPSLPAANEGNLSVRQITADPGIARCFFTGLTERAGQEAPRLLHSAWHSDFPALDDDAAFFLAACLDKGGSAAGNLADPHIGRIAKAAQRANREKQLFLGLVRFRLLSDGTYYAPVNPDCDLLPLLASHFHRRFFNQAWIIHDVHRGRALFHAKSGSTEGITIEAIEGMDLSRLKKGGELPDDILAPTEKAVQAAFRLYYNDISIRERKNASVQRNHLPQKYWLHLIETPGSSKTS